METFFSREVLVAFRAGQKQSSPQIYQFDFVFVTFAKRCYLQPDLSPELCNKKVAAREGKKPLTEGGRATERWKVVGKPESHLEFAVK